MIEGNLENFAELTGAGRVLVDFNAEWCGPCQALAPILEEAVEEIPEETGVKVVSVNIDENPELAEKFEVMSIPCLVVLEDGKEVERMVGLVSKRKILKMVGVK